MAGSSESVRPRNRDSNLKMLSVSGAAMRGDSFHVFFAISVNIKTFEGFDPGSE